MIVKFLPSRRHDANRLGVGFVAVVGGEYQYVFISDEALDDHFGGDAAKHTEAREKLFDENRARIESVATALIIGGVEGEVVITTHDFA